MSEIQHFSLAGVLPEGSRIAVNTDLGILSVITENGVVISQSLVTSAEQSVAMPLFVFHPYPCHYDHLLAAFNGADFQDDKIVVKYRVMLQKAYMEGYWDAEMHPARGTVSRLRQKLHPLSIDVVSILETGYTLKQYEESVVRASRRHNKH